MKISSVGIKLNPNVQNTEKCSCPKPKALSQSIGADNVFKYMSAIPFISFKGAEEKPTFDETVEKNYFQLPIITTKKGNKIQALPDKTQLACAKSLYEGKNTVCIAPTGTGKTAIANYVITKNMNEGKKTIYTTPLKALSNDKYREFCKIYGKENVGLLTGDIKLKSKAPILIMTTEIYRNMALDAYAKDNYTKFYNVGTVIFDEAHYISEKERGKIWEESVMLTPPDVQILPLSATIGNGKEFTDWAEEVTGRPTNLIEASPKDRHVPLVYYNYTGDRKNGFEELIIGDVNIQSVKDAWEKDSLSQRQKRALDILVQKVKNEDDDYNATKEEQKEILDELSEITKGQIRHHHDFSYIIGKRRRFNLTELEAQEVTQLLLDSDSRTIKNFAGHEKKQGKRSGYEKLVRALKGEEKLPALVFAFSRRNCNEASKNLADMGLGLTTKEEQEEIEKIINKYEEEGIYLGSKFDKKQLIQGIAPHHAGLLPSYKKLVEDLFSKKLLKVVFATSTLSAGINMPAKTVVITSIDRPQGNQFGDIEYVPLTSNEFHQMSGRAGRRGIDRVGNVVLYDINGKQAQIAKNLILKSPDGAKSSYSPTYSFLPAYYEKCEDDDLLNYFEQNTLKVYQSKNKEQEINNLKSEFRKYRDILLSKGFLSQTENGYAPTTKGRMLVKVHGYNEIPLVNAIYDKTLKNLTPVELASFAAAMGAQKMGEDELNDFNDFVEYLAKNTCDKTGSEELLNALDMAEEDDDDLSMLEKVKKVKVPTANATGVFEAAVAYAFASANEENPENSIENFKAIGDKIFGTGYNPRKLAPNTERGLEDGALYNKIATSIDVLKQIINVCEFMINSGRYDDLKYYQNLIVNAKKAINLVKQPPIYDVSAIENNEN